ncbi:MAG: SH3 domain-containing protein, partial [Prevotella sp.]|nr:SH3 domain-containing protein [Prevotella sp.]
MNKSFLYYVIALLLSFCTNSFGFTKYVTNNLNLRYEANTHSYILTVIPRGTAVTIDEDCDCKWVPVEYNGYVGYISTKYLSNTPVRKTYKHRIGTSV